MGGDSKSKLNKHRPEIEALLKNGSTRKFVAGRYGAAEADLHNWLKKQPQSKDGQNPLGETARNQTDGVTNRMYFFGGGRKFCVSSKLLLNCNFSSASFEASPSYLLRGNKIAEIWRSAGVAGLFLFDRIEISRKQFVLLFAPDSRQQF